MLLSCICARDVDLFAICYFVVGWICWFWFVLCFEFVYCLRLNLYCLIYVVLLFWFDFWVLWFVFRRVDCLRVAFKLWRVCFSLLVFVYLVCFCFGFVCCVVIACCGWWYLVCWFGLACLSVCWLNLGVLVILGWCWVGKLVFTLNVIGGMLVAFSLWKLVCLLFWVGCLFACDLGGDRFVYDVGYVLFVVCYWCWAYGLVFVCWFDKFSWVCFIVRIVCFVCLLLVLVLICRYCLGLVFSVWCGFGVIVVLLFYLCVWFVLFVCFVVWCFRIVCWFSVSWLHCFSLLLFG